MAQETVRFPRILQLQRFIRAYLSFFIRLFLVCSVEVLVINKKKQKTKQKKRRDIKFTDSKIYSKAVYVSNICA